jgi:hypothetical protein
VITGPTTHQLLRKGVVKLCEGGGGWVQNGTEPQATNDAGNPTLPCDLP